MFGHASVVLLTFAALVTSGVDGVAVPEQIHLALGKTTATMVVSWVTMQPMTSGPATVQYGIGTLDKSATANTTVFTYGKITRYMHDCEIFLQPNAKYSYRVGGPEAWSQQYSFRSFPAGNDFAFKAVVFGDLGYLNGTSIPFLIAAARHGEFDLVIHVGDIAYDLHTDDGVRGDLYMRELEPMLAIVPYMVIAGNHEDDGKNFSHYQKRFRMPAPDNQFYSFDVGPVHFVGVSTEYYGYFYEYGQGPVMNQFNWLHDDLKAANGNRKNVPWIMSYQHRPFYCSNSNSEECHSFENRLVRRGYEEMPGLEPVFNAWGMDVGFWGHEHSYERFLPVNNRTVYNGGANPYHNAPAPTYIISGSAGCHSPKAGFGAPNPASAMRSDDFGYSLVHVFNHTHVQMQQISVEKGGPIDQIWLVKDPGHRVEAKGRVGTPFPPYEEFMSRCSVRDARCRADVEARKKQLANPFFRP